MTYRTLFVAYIYLALACLATQPSLSAQGQERQPLPLDSIISAETHHKGVRIGLQVMRISDGAILYDHRSDELFTPASIVKILSTGAAMRQRGYRHRFTTNVYAVGLIGAGTLQGGLLIAGGGDPSIASAFVPQDTMRLVTEISRALSRAGVSNIEGRIFVDGSLAHGVGAHPTWAREDISRPYGAGFYGFNVRDNTITASLLAPRTGNTRPELTPRADSDGIVWTSAVTTGRARSISISLTPGESSVRLSGRMPRGTSQHLRIANPDPAMTGAQWIDKSLRSQGIQTQGNPQRSYLGYEVEGRLIHTYYSLPLDTLSIITNHHSQNLYAEAIAHLIDPRRSPGEAVQTYWRKALGMGAKDLNILDGSGLSRSNRITPKAMTQALKYLFGGEQPHDGILVETLPQVGRDGTVARLMSASDITAYLKSGTMRGVTCYAGYLYHEGEWYTLSYMANGFAKATDARSLLKTFLLAAFPPTTEPQLTRERQ